MCSYLFEFALICVKGTKRGHRIGSQLVVRMQNLYDQLLVNADVKNSLRMFYRLGFRKVWNEHLIK
jgi:hypothetical protein